MNYLPHLDGIRAIAIVLVLGFHFFPENLFGGFIGVDVFFILSGYLITYTYSQSLLENRFSFWDFYSRRLKRILPPIILLLISTSLLAGIFMVAPEQEAYVIAAQKLALYSMQIFIITILLATSTHLPYISLYYIFGHFLLKNNFTSYGL